jgi:hypothetical protein
MQTYTQCLALFTATVCLVGCHPSEQSHAAAASVTSTRDAADAFVNAAPFGSAMVVDGIGTTGASASVRYLNACDNSVQWDAPSQGANDGDTMITPIATGTTQLRVCSYSILNGAAAQDVQFFFGTTSASSSSGNVCGVTGSQLPFVAYHLGPYESIARGSGVGVLYSLNPGGGICIHRKQNGTNPLGIEVTYAIN